MFTVPTITTKLDVLEVLEVQKAKKTEWQHEVDHIPHNDVLPQT